MDFSSLQNGLINCLNVSIRLVVFEQYFVYHSICPNCLKFLQSKAEFFVPSTLVAAMFRNSGILDRSKCHMMLFIRRNLPQGITVMIINTGQMCIVNYPGRPRIRDLSAATGKKPTGKKICRRSSLAKKNKKKTKRKAYGVSRDKFFVSYSN